MPMYSTLPANHDAEFIFAKAGVTSHYGYDILEDGQIRLGYSVSDGEAMAAAIAAFPVDYANEVIKPRMADELAALRWQKSQRFVYDGVETWAHAAVADIVAAIMSIERGPNPTELFPWKLAKGQWRQWSVADLVAYGQAVRAHVQACFTQEEVLAFTIDNAANITELEAIDITTGWPV